MANTVQVVQLGLGPIGLKLTRYMADKRHLRIVGGVDIDPEKTGRDLGDLAGLETPLGVPVADSLEAALRTTEAQVAVVTTVSSIVELVPQIQELVSRGLNVVSTCEELAYPWNSRPEPSRQIDQAARSAGVSVLGTGINPGFLMDYLPIAMTSVCRKVEKIRVERLMDASKRRIPFQKKIGAGLTPEEFQSRVDKRTLRHVGLTESLHMIAARLGWDLDRTEDVVEPVLAERETMGIPAGRALGVNQIGRGFRAGIEVLTLVFHSTIGQPNPRDRIQISGTPELEVVIPGGVNGDIGTCAITTNAIPPVVRAAPGLRTMADIEVIGCES